MAATFNWKITNIACRPQVDDKTNVVYTIYWECSASQIENDVTYNASVQKNTKITYQQSDSFTEYDQLTQDQVLGWVWNEVNQTIKGKNGQPDTIITVKEAAEAELQNSINRQIAPSIVYNPLPWS